MALSNWDLLAFNNEGKSCNGVLENPGSGILGGSRGSKVEIYKNWLYVHNKKMWNKGLGYNRPVIAEIWSGDINLSGFEIHVIRGSQDSIFIYVETKKYLKKKIITKRMAGIGCCGYSDILPILIKKAGVKEEDWDDIFESTCSYDNKTTITLHCSKKENEDIKYEKFEFTETDELKSKWIGVLSSTYDEFIKWLKERETEDEFTKDYFDWINSFEIAQRCNQGDMYFAKHLGIDIPNTKIGEVDTPVLEKIVENIK
jgi:hypothetical protein